MKASGLRYTMSANIGIPGQHTAVTRIAHCVGTMLGRRTTT
jgi:hypothetical protein